MVTAKRKGSVKTIKSSGKNQVRKSISKNGGDEKQKPVRHRRGGPHAKIPQPEAEQPKKKKKLSRKERKRKMLAELDQQILDTKKALKSENSKCVCSCHL